MAFFPYTILDPGRELVVRAGNPGVQILLASDLGRAAMPTASQHRITEVTDILRSLRNAVNGLEQLELAQVGNLRGEQTVDSKQSLSQCFTEFQRCITDMEDALASIAEATGDVSTP
jgi:hypothetical protein